MMAVIKLEIIMFDCHVSKKPLYIPQRYHKKVWLLAWWLDLVSADLITLYFTSAHKLPRITVFVKQLETVRSGPKGLFYRSAIMDFRLSYDLQY